MTTNDQAIIARCPVAPFQLVVVVGQRQQLKMLLLLLLLTAAAAAAAPYSFGWLTRSKVRPLKQAVLCYAVLWWPALVGAASLAPSDRAWLARLRTPGTATRQNEPVPAEEL